MAGCSRQQLAMFFWCVSRGRVASAKFMFPDPMWKKRYNKSLARSKLLSTNAPEKLQFGNFVILLFRESGPTLLFSSFHNKFTVAVTIGFSPNSELWPDYWPVSTSASGIPATRKSLNGFPVCCVRKQLFSGDARRDCLSDRLGEVINDEQQANGWRAFDGCREQQSSFRK